MGVRAFGFHRNAAGNRIHTLELGYATAHLLSHNGG